MSKRKLHSLPLIALKLFLMIMGLEFFPAEGSSSQNITQPIGDLIRVWETSGSIPLALQPPSRIPPFATPTTPVQEVNYICAQWDFNVIPQTVPFDLNTAVTEIVLTKPQHFVRLYAPASGSSPNGVWIIRSEYVRGLTPEQLKDRFALPSLPTNIVNVDLPASPDPATGKDYALWTGIAGPTAGFGNGGGVQIELWPISMGPIIFQITNLSLGFATILNSLAILPFLINLWQAKVIRRILLLIWINLYPEPIATWKMSTLY